MSDAETPGRTSSRTDGVDAHDTAEGLVLYAHREDSVHQLNAMSTVIYELSDGRPLESIARSVAEIFELDEPAARSAVLDGYEQLRSLGLVG